ncbi:MAG TPA: DNA mismatch endonuclease Vsr [Kiritimatiellia bacterium]|nr:DNA mismatch endonuclease Vsr [Kiritimatiellia bacterium]HMP35199.1 DNA mismatch endonuclease Vsr [Kiritimatiellia bacterium]
MDIWSKTKRAMVMSRIRSSDTKPELIVRSMLHRAGFRFVLHRRDLPGRPDIVLPKYRAVVFVHGCFWHRHKGCKSAAMPKTRKRFWTEKFAGNVLRDKRNSIALRRAGWSVIVVWECDVQRDPNGTLANVIKRLGSRQGHE